MPAAGDTFTEPWNVGRVTGRGLIRSKSGAITALYKDAEDVLSRETKRPEWETEYSPHSMGEGGIFC
jgi:hypothetical protein